MVTRRGRGYTIVEILSVLGIVSVLALIAAGGYSTLIKNFQDRDARSTVDRVAGAQRVWASRNGAWTSDLSELGTGRNITLTAGTSTSRTVVSVSVLNGTRVGIAVRSASGKCIGKVMEDPLTDRGESWVEVPAPQTCNGSNALARA